MSDEPLYCTWCGAEDYHCDCRKDRDGGVYCESHYTHEWKELGDGSARCVHCGLRAVVAEPIEGGLRVVRVNAADLELVREPHDRESEGSKF